jgi:Zn-dependent peptidase ImmA (M78 family)/DNA-binding XRE family transcriptional regulator
MSKELIFNPEKLKAARLIKGYSLQELADQIGNKVTKQAINKYEKGEVKPDNDMIGVLSTALSVTPVFFQRKSNITLGTLNFRKLQDLTARDKKIVIEKTKDSLERYIEIEQLLGISELFTNPIKDRIIKDVNDVEESVEFLRTEWNLGYDAISNVVDLLEEHHIKFIEVELDDKFDGCQTLMDDKFPVIVLNKNKIKTCDRKRFTALHELGHLLLNFDQALDENMKEHLCHRFAGAMLIHKSIAIKAFGEKRNNITIQELGSIKIRYGISIAALLYRLKDLNIISANFYKNFMFILTMTGQRKVESIVYTGKESGHRFLQLLFRAIGEKKIDFAQAAEISGYSEKEIREAVFPIQDNLGLLAPVICG